MKKNKSFVNFCVFYLSIYSLLLFLTFILTNTLINNSIINVSKTLYDFIKYDYLLKEDEFDKIPVKKFKRNEIVIFDENKEVLFSTNNYEEVFLTKDELMFINEYFTDTYFLVQSINNGNYLITENNYNQENKQTEILNYAILDSNYNIIEGILFEGKTKLSEKEFILLKEGMNGKSYVSKYSYVNNEGKERILVFYERYLSNEEYEKITDNILSRWIFVIPIILVLSGIIIIIFYYKIKKSINIMKKRILDDNYALKKKNNIPIEFNEFCIKIKDLLKKLELEKKKTEKEEKLRQSIITNLSHDIKTPLTVIQGYAKAFCDGVVPKDKEKKYMEAIYNKSVISTEIINSLFQYSQMEHVDFKANYEESDFSEFCREYLAIKYSDLEMLKYNLTFKLEEKTIMYNFDRSLMTRLFDNIINNSVKHNKKNTTVYFIYKVVNNCIIITIADNGKGIVSKDPNVLFTPFVVENEARTCDSSTGLGLYIVKKIVEMHNGEISINKNPKKPYKFEINIKFKL